MQRFHRLLGAVVAVSLLAGCANTEPDSDVDDDAAADTTDEAPEGDATEEAGDDEDATAPSSDEQLLVGFIAPLSGPAGPNGEDVLEAVEVMADIINDEGGCLDRQIEIISRDDQSEPAAGVSAANELVGEGVDVVMGGWNSPVTLAIQPVLVRAGVLNITSIPQNTAILGGADDAAVRMNAGNAVGANVAAQFIAEDLEAATVATLVQNDAYGIDAGEGVVAELEKLGVEIVEQQQFEFTDTDFRIPLSNLAAAGPDVVFSANAAESSGMPAMAQQLAESSLEALHFAGTGTVSPTVVDLAGGDIVDGMYTADLYFPEEEPFSSFERNQQFVEAYLEASGGDLPDKFRALGAQSLDVWCEAIERAGTTERSAVAAEIHGGSFEGTILGDVTFTDSGQQQFPMYAVVIEDGALTVLREVEVDAEAWG
jgi:branched-chain amino acid transport system substrate-binding protein